MMIDQKEVCIWFKNLEGHSRIELMCTLLDSCLPLELRFLGTYLEYSAGKHYTHMQKWEKDANNSNSFGSAARDLLDTTIRRRLCIFLALLHSHNRSVAIKLFDALNDYDFLNKDSEGTKLSRSIVEMKLLLTMASLHPAFDFEQREDMRKKLKEFLVAFNVTESQTQMKTEAEKKSDPVEQDVKTATQTFVPEATSSITPAAMPSVNTLLPLNPMQAPVAGIKAPLLPPPNLASNKIQYPMYPKSYQYTIPIQSHFPSQPNQQMVIPRQPMPVMSPHREPMYNLNSLTGNVMKPAPYIRTLVSPSVTHPVGNNVLPTVHSLPTLPIVSSPSSADFVNLNGVNLNENTGDNKWSISKTNMVYSTKQPTESVARINQQLKNPMNLQRVRRDNPENPSEILVSLYDGLMRSNTSLNKLNSSSNNIELSTLQSPCIPSATLLKEHPRRCFSESDAYESINIRGENSPLGRVSMDHNANQPLHSPQFQQFQSGPRPVYLPYANSTLAVHSSSVASPVNYTDAHLLNGDLMHDKITLASSVTRMAAPTMTSTNSEPQITPTYTCQVGKHIIPTGLNGGYIQQPILISESANRKMSNTDLQKNQNVEAYQNPPVPINLSLSEVENVFFPAQSHQINATVTQNSVFTSTTPSTTHMSATTNSTLEANSMSPRSVPSPRLSPFPSPGNSPMISRKGGYQNYKENLEALSSGACWLKSLRLHKYSDVFEGYTFQMMTELDDDGLEKLGLTTGATKKFRQAVNHLSSKGFKDFGNFANQLSSESISQLLFSPTSASPQDSPSNKSSPPQTIDSSNSSQVNSSSSSSIVGSNVVEDFKSLPRATYDLQRTNRTSVVTVSPADSPGKSTTASSPLNVEGLANFVSSSASNSYEGAMESVRKNQVATCYNCGTLGHYGDECTEQTMEAQTYNRYAFHLDFTSVTHSNTSTMDTDDTVNR